MPKRSAVTRAILAQNAGRDAERLLLKLELMRRDPFAFFRGANALHLGFLPRGHALFRAPNTLVCGDLHLENFGAFKGDNRLCYFDVNDFDDACIAPFTVDIVRFLAGFHGAFGLVSGGAAQRGHLVDAFLDAYSAAIADGKPRWLERSLAKGVFRTLLGGAMRRTRAALLDRFTRSADGTREIRIDGRRTVSLREGERRRLRKFADRTGRALDAPVFFRLKGAARRVAGNGSLGLPRYLLLVRGRGSPDGNFVLDLKFAAPSATAAWLGRAQPEWRDDAARVVAIQRIMQAIPPAMLRAAEFDKSSFVLKELQPSIDRLDFSEWRKKPKRVLQAVEGMGRVAAWAHLRGCGHFDTTSVEALQAYVRKDAWRRGSRRLAENVAERMLAAYRRYVRDYDAGVVTSAVEPP